MWLFLIASACLIAPASLFVHDYMLETLKVPYPTTVGLPMAVKFLNDVVRFSALAAICRLARPQLQGLSRLSAACLAGLFIVMLAETFRVLAIETAILGSFRYTVVDIAPRALSSFVGGAAAAWIGLGDQKRRNVVFAVLLIAALVTFGVHPALDAASASLKNILPEPTELYSDPYPFKINVLIYVTFIEPTIAAFMMAASCWLALRGPPLRRILAFAALLLLVRGRFVSFFVESFWVNQALPTGFLAESQFFLETLTLGLLAGLAWSVAVKIRER